MGPLTFGTILKAALIAGLAAGLTAALFHLVFTEPLIDRAIALEGIRAAVARGSWTTDPREPAQDGDGDGKCQ